MFLTILEIFTQIIYGFGNIQITLWNGYTLSLWYLIIGVLVMGAICRMFLHFIFDERGWTSYMDADLNNFIKGNMEEISKVKSFKKVVYDNNKRNYGDLDQYYDN